MRWPKAKLSEILAEATREGICIASTVDAEGAAKLRFALYKRAQRDRVRGLSIVLEGANVIVTLAAAAGVEIQHVQQLERKDDTV